MKTCPRIYLLFLILFTTLLTLGGAGTGYPRTEPGKDIEELFHAQLRELNKTIGLLEKMVLEHQPLERLREQFKSCRYAYKRASILLDYFYPYQWRQINGPDIRKAEEDNPDVLIPPSGFQVIERLMNSPVSDSTYTLINKEVYTLNGLIASIDAQQGSAHKFSSERVFDALRSADIRLVARGITGFDSPLLLNSMPEARATLEGMSQVLSVYKETVLNKEADSIIPLISKAITYLSENDQFNSFDRLTFIRDFADPLYGMLVSIAERENIMLPDERRPINQFSKNLFDQQLLDVNYFSPNSRYQVTGKRIYLGSLLFSDSIFSPVSKRSCASCHQPDRAFTDGLVSPRALNDTGRLTRNTPTLLNAALQTRFFYDSRTETLENQLNSVVHNVDEMNGSLRASIPLLKEDKLYGKLFKEAYPEEAVPVTEYNIANAISSYVRSLVRLDSKFDRYMRNENAELSSREKRGFNLYAGKAKCATCHYMPLFNGLVPPFFSETESEVIGVPAGRKRKNVLDRDQGKYDFTLSEADRHAFKTPGLRNVALTAPYMHNGVFKTLEEVLDFYNKGGGSGLSIAPANQTLPPEPLGLNRGEIRDIITFLKTLTSDTRSQTH